MAGMHFIHQHKIFSAQVKEWCLITLKENWKEKINFAHTPCP